MSLSLRLGDCLDVMGDLAAESIDLIAADLPYGTTACKWDAVIPFGPLWVHYRRLLKPRGAVVLTASQPFTSFVVASNPKWFRHAWAWDKGIAGGGLNAHVGPMKVHEDVLVFGPRRVMFNKQMRQGKPKRYNVQLVPNGPTRKDSGYVLRGYENPSGQYNPRSILPITNADRRTERLHPTQKPVALMEYLIRTYTDEGMTVLDNTMGSGTTGVACLRTGRDFIGIERDPGYFAVAERRLAEESGRHPLLNGAS